MEVLSANFVELNLINTFFTSDKTEITGCTNLIELHGLEHTYNKFCNKKGKEELSSFLPHLPGFIDASGHQDNR